MAHPTLPQAVHLIRHVTSAGKVCVLITNLFEMACFPAAEFDDL